MRYLIPLALFIGGPALVASCLLFVADKSYLRGYQAGFDRGVEVISNNVGTLINRPHMKKYMKTQLCKDNTQ